MQGTSPQKLILEVRVQGSTSFKRLAFPKLVPFGRSLEGFSVLVHYFMQTIFHIPPNINSSLCAKPSRLE